jgi:hypothetical protein
MFNKILGDRKRRKKLSSFNPNRRDDSRDMMNQVFFLIHTDPSENSSIYTIGTS